MIEEWRSVPNSRYQLQVSNLGRVIRKGCILHQLNPRLKRDIGRLILEAFVGSCPDGKECCHKDDNRFNNAVDNLYWGTKSDNALDAIANGKHTPVVGEGNGRAKLTTSKVVLARLLHKMNPSVWRSQLLAKIMDVTNAVMWHVLNRKTWRHVP